MRWASGGLFSALLLTGLAVACPSYAAPQAEQSAQAPAWTVPDNAEIRRILVDRIDVQRQGVGIVVGVIDAHGRRIVTYGSYDKGDPRQLDGDTLFEIGSITKVFTSLLLSDMVGRGEVALDDPISKFLPPGVTAPQRNGREITLADLATHTSGLPRMPTNFAPADAENPYADYTVDRLWSFLSGYQLTRDVGASYEYSNVGVALLGQLLARREGVDYETLLNRRIIGPLGLRSTMFALPRQMKVRLATGHTADLAPTVDWDLNAFAPAGGLKSSANDLLTLLGEELGFESTPLAPAMKAQLAVRRPIIASRGQTALAWQILSTSRGEVVWHNGETGGYRTFIGFDPKAKVGVVVLTNVSNPRRGDDIATHLLTGAPLAKLPPPSQHAAIKLDESVLRRFVGRYQLGPATVVDVTLQDGRLFAQLTNQGRFEIFPESPTRVFWRVVDAQADFALDSSGHATMLTLHQNGRDLPAPLVRQR